MFSIIVCLLICTIVLNYLAVQPIFDEKKTKTEVVLD